MAWKFHSYFERWKLDINKCSERLRKYNDRLLKFTEISLTLKIMVKIYLNYEILRTEIWNMSPEIFQKVENFIWTLIYLYFVDNFQSLSTPRLTKPS